MISVYNLKKNFQNILRPISDALYKCGVTANMVTISALVLSLATGLVIYFTKSPIALAMLPLVLFVRMALNAIDGMLAREHNQKSIVGIYLNEIGDVLSDVFIYVPVLWYCGICEHLTLLFTILMIISELVGIMGVQAGADRRYEGPMGKSDRAFVFGTLGLVLFFIVIHTVYLNWLIAVLSVLLVWTSFNRIKSGIKQAK